MSLFEASSNGIGVISGSIAGIIVALGFIPTAIAMLTGQPFEGILDTTFDVAAPFLDFAEATLY